MRSREGEVRVDPPDSQSYISHYPLLVDAIYDLKLAKHPTSDKKFNMKEQQGHNQAVLLADNFPAKAFLLISHLTDADHEVASFSSDGAAFEVYDQSIFAQKYLPQYFKHSNYGSFVRQLNLYGFTSSRLRTNSEVVVWSHDSFRRDRKDLVKDIKRTKKTKSAKPPHVHINPRSPSPPSLSSGDDTSSNGAHITVQGRGIDQSWLESEFAQLKQHNMYLEQKLDTLLKITLRISTTSAAELHVGEKRRRMDPLESAKPMSPIESNRPTYDQHGSIYDEQKLFYDENYGEQLEPYEGNPGKLPRDDGSNRNGGERHAGQGDHDFAHKDELKRFVDIMLTEDDHQESKWEDVTPSNLTRPENREAPVTLPEADSQDALEEELTEEAMNTLAPMDTGGDLFTLEEDPDESCAFQVYQPNQIFTEANAAVVKADGPQPVRSSSSDGPEVVNGGDLEEGHAPVGVAIIAAEAELIEDEGDWNRDLNEENLHQLERDRQQRQEHRRKVLLLLGFIGVGLIVGVTWPAVALTRKAKRSYSISMREKEKGSPSRDEWRPPPPSRPCKEGDRHSGCVLHDSHDGEKESHWGDDGYGEGQRMENHDKELGGQVEDLENHDEELEGHAEDLENHDEELEGHAEDLESEEEEPADNNSDEDIISIEVSRSFKKGRGQIWDRASSIFDADVNKPDVNSFSITLGGADFECIRGEYPM